MNSNRDPKVDRQDEPEPGKTGAVAPAELFTDGLVTQLSLVQERAADRHAAWERQFWGKR